MRFTPNLGTPFRDKDGLDALTKAAQNDAQNVTAAAKPEEKGTGDPSADKLIELAKTQLGVKYVYGARQWGKALDCSGFTQQAFAQMGINIGGDTYTQVTQGSAVSDIGQAKAGDLVFFTGDIGMRRNGHVGIYLGGGMMIDAPHTGAQVRIEPIHSNVTAIRRFL
jgi:cell wall-associated NlpC family hydrolase